MGGGRRDNGAYESKYLTREYSEYIYFFGRMAALICVCRKRATKRLLGRSSLLHVTLSEAPDGRVSGHCVEFGAGASFNKRLRRDSIASGQHVACGTFQCIILMSLHCK